MKPLRELLPGAGAVFGGKAEGLARLIAAGAPVPEGFALEAGTSPPGEWDEETRSAFLRSSSELLKTGLLAVRSSALAEDSEERSFAGLFETSLGVRTPEEALAAAWRCVASGGAERVLAYAGSASPLPVGVVVQVMVPAAKAGVCFTRDPAGRDSAVVVEAVAGTGDALVSGRTAPERWRAYLSGLGTWACRPEGGCAVLDSMEVEAAAAQARSLERTLGMPLDLEWAIDREGALWWLQARPITALKEPPRYDIRRSEEGADDGPVTVWSNCNVRETMPDPLMPLTWSHWVESLMPALGHLLFGFEQGSPYIRQLFGLDLVNGRMYFNMNTFLALPVVGPLTLWLIEGLDARTAAAARALVRDRVLTKRRLKGPRLHLELAFLLASLRGISRFRVGLLPRRALRRLEEDGPACARGKPPAELTEAELLRELRLFEKPENFRIFFGLQMEGMAFFVYRAAHSAFRGHCRALELLTTGIPANPTTQISIGIEELAEAAEPLREHFRAPREARELLASLAGVPGGPEWLALLEGFLRRFGHRGPREFDLGAPRWEEDPSMILGLVRAQLAAPAREGVRARIERLGRERRAALAEALAGSPFWKRPWMRAMARLVALYMPLREAPKHYGMFAFGRIRKCALELGRRLAAAGTLDAPEDVFFLEMSEIETLALGRGCGRDPRETVREREALHERFLGEPAPDMLRSDGVPVWEEGPGAASGEGVLRGTPISAGKVCGPVRVLSEPDPSAMEEGDVLVMAFADPGWTPLFPRASAVVMEVGGLMCHAAVVAREMGVPAVFGVKDATKLLADGQLVEVDGGAGTVALQSP